MLPFLQPKKMASMIIASRKPDGTSAPDEHEGEHAPELMQHASALISAIHAKDENAAAAALKEIHTHFNNPHETE